MKLFFPICFFAVSILLAGCVGGSGGFVVVEEFSECPLCKAAKEGDSDRVDILLAAGANPNAVDKKGSTALMYAAGKGHAEIAKSLLDAEANPNVVDDDGWTALIVATFEGHYEFVKILLDGEANPNVAGKDDWTALIQAAINGNTEISKIMLSAGANPNAADNEGRTALMGAAFEGHAEVAKILLDGGANPNAAKDGGFTALIFSTEEGHSEVAKVLLDGGANPNAVLSSGETALIYASNKGHAEVAKVLLDGGANPNVARDSGETALMMAAHFGHAEVAKVLLECGASPDKRNNEGINAWHWANRQPVMHAIFYEYLDKVKAGWSPKSCKGRDFNPVAEVPQMANPDSIQSPQTTNLGESVFAKVWQSIVVVKSGERQGSGVVISPNTIATNCHVLGGGQIIVYKHNNRRASTDTVYSASIIKRDNYRDFCILRVQNLNGIPAKIRKYDSLNIGENVYAVGSPQGLDLSLSTGVISQLRQSADRRWIQTDAAISPGSSGGGLFDSSGNLIGITTEKITDENVEGIAFAIPADLAVGY